MPLHRLIEIIESGSIYFASARQFFDNDPFEGAVKIIDDDYVPQDSKQEIFLKCQKPFESLTKLYKINCWHASDFENVVMCKSFLTSNKFTSLLS